MLTFPYTHMKEIRDKTGKLYYRLKNGAFLIGAKNFKDSGITYSEKIVVPARKPDKIVELKTSVTQAQLYRLSGDYNPLHVDPTSAQMFGFKEPILHGLCTLGFTARAALKAYGNNDPEKFKALKVRFSKPVLPGQTLQVEMWNQGSRIILLTKVKETGKVVISNAYLDIHAGPFSKL